MEHTSLDATIMCQLGDDKERLTLLKLTMFLSIVMKAVSYVH